MQTHTASSCTSRRKRRIPDWRRSKRATWLARVHRPAWRRRSGCARSKTGDCWTRRVRECWQDSHSAAMRFWSSTRGGYSANARPQCRASWRRSLTVWARPPKAGGHGSQNSVRAGSSARPRGHLRPPAGVRQPTGCAPARQSGAVPGPMKAAVGWNWSRPAIGGQAARRFPVDKAMTVRPLRGSSPLRASLS